MWRHYWGKRWERCLKFNGVDFYAAEVGNVWHKIFAVLREDADFEEVYVDSTVVRAHQHAAGAAKKKDSKLLAALAED